MDFEQNLQTEDADITAIIAKELQRQQEQLLAPITQKLQNAIQAVGAEGGYTFIYDMSIPAILYTGTGAEDVSAKVKAKLGIK